MRNDVMPPPAPPVMSVPPARMSIARRTLLDLPIAASGAGAATTTPLSASPVPPVPAADSSMIEPGYIDTDAMRLASTDVAVTDPDFGLSSTFDVPAFLRRQEG
jgi:hypothetical protein